MCVVLWTYVLFIYMKDKQIIVEMIKVYEFMTSGNWIRNAYDEWTKFIIFYFM